MTLHSDVRPSFGAGHHERFAREGDDLAHQMEHAGAESELAHLADDNLFDKVVNGVVGMCGAAVLMFMTGLVFVNAVMRYTMNSGLIWADDVVVSLVPWLAMLGMYLSVRRREIIRIEFFAERLPGRAKQVVPALSDLIAAAAFGYLAIVSFDFVTLFGTDRSVYTGLARGWFTSAMLLGAIIVAIAFIIDFVGRLRGRGERV